MVPPTIVLGLGNPGRAYAGTRHNLGFRVVDRLAAAWGVEFAFAAGWGRKVWTAESLEREPPVVLAKPRTYMNRSGRAVDVLCPLYQTTAPNFLVVCDDADLELGRVRIREAGRAGGHNGLRSLIERFGSDAFPRVKLGVRGVGREEIELADYVLARFEPDEEPVVERLVTRGAAAVCGVLEHGVRAAMNQHNGPDRGSCATGEAPTPTE